MRQHTKTILILCTAGHAKSITTHTTHLFHCIFVSKMIFTPIRFQWYGKPYHRSDCSLQKFEPSSILIFAIIWYQIWFCLCLSQSLQSLLRRKFCIFLFPSSIRLRSLRLSFIIQIEFGSCLSPKVTYSYTIDLFCLTNTIFHFRIKLTHTILHTYTQSRKRERERAREEKDR